MKYVCFSLALTRQKWRRRKLGSSLKDSELHKNWQILRGAVVAQLAERSLPLIVDPGSNPATGNFNF